MHQTHSQIRSFVLFLAISGCGTSTAPDLAPHEATESEAYYGGEQGMADDDAAGAPPAAMARQSVGSTTVMAEPVSGADGSAEEADASGGGAEQAQSWRRLTNASRFATVSLGGGNSLELKKVRVSVQVEGMRARTIVDHIFYNPHGRALEGTFRYPLPPEASISSYAMYLGSGQQQPDFFGSDANLPANVTVDQMMQQVDPQSWGELRVGRNVKAEQGREVYENVTRRRIDPALVEEVAPNTFEARVFPIQANGFHRVIVSYEQTLPRIGSELEYVFPIPEGEVEALELALSSDAARARYTGDFPVREQQGRFSSRVRGRLQGGAHSFRFAAARGPIEVVAGAHPERNERHFVARLHGDQRLPAARSQGTEQAVFLIDTSLSESPDRFNLDVALLKNILERSPQIRRFNVITFDAGARWLSRGWLSNDARGRGEALDRLEDALLEGATDLSAALDLLANPPMSRSGNALDVFLLTDGALSWGERDAETLVRRFRTSGWQARFFAYRTGLGAENLELLRRLTQGGGVFNCLSQSSIPACSVAHQAPGLRIENVRVVARGQRGAMVSDVVIAGGASTLTRGGELMIAGRIDREGPAELRIEGKIGAERRVLTYPIELRASGDLASRAWAEIAVAHLLSTHDPDLEDLAVALSQHYRIPSRATSFLVLETDAEYAQYDLEEARRDLRGAPIQTLVSNATQQSGGARTSWQRLVRALEAGRSHHNLPADVMATIERFASQAPVDFVPGRESIPLLRTSDASRSYRRSMSHDAESSETYRAEGESRREDGEIGAAIRALSSAIENAPASAEVARMVGYTLTSWGAHAEAAEVFLNVLEKRPYEPQSYRDLAGALWTRRPSLTALLYEAVLAGQWDARFRGVQTIAHEEYALFSRAWQRMGPRSPLASYLRERQQALGLTVPESDLRVTMTWNTDNTDIDLHVTDPRGDECYYGNRQIPSGGQLLDDVTQGFGPERFQAVDAVNGRYRVVAKYYSNNGNRLVARTYVTLTVATYVGSPQEQVRRYVVALGDRGDTAEVATIEM